CFRLASPTPRPGAPARPQRRTRRTPPPSLRWTDDGGAGGMTWPEIILRLALVLVAFLVLPLIVGQLEHKTMAHMQSRLGRMSAAGFRWWRRSTGDGARSAQKGVLPPKPADRVVFALAPGVALVPYLVVLIVIPIGPGDAVGQALDIGLFFVLAVTAVGV